MYSYTNQYRPDDDGMFLYRALRKEGIEPQVAAATAWPDDEPRQERVLSLERQYALRSEEEIDARENGNPQEHPIMKTWRGRKNHLPD